MNIENQIPVPSDDRQRIEALEQKIDAIYVSVERTRKYILASLIVTVALIVLPLIGLVFAIPVFIDSVSTISNSGLLEDL